MKQSLVPDSHINRLKAAWKNKNPSQEILNTWTKHYLARKILANTLKLPLPKVIKLYKESLNA